MPARKTVITGNWKMYKTVDEAVGYIKELTVLINGQPAFLAVPYTLIQAASEAAAGSSIVIGAQNMNDATEGAFTGEIAGKMLQDVGAKFVILGHSERRRIFNEDDAFINRKVKRALEVGLQPVLCVGETLQEREEGKTQDVLESQILGSLADVKDLSSLVLAYEPVWAIGTGKTATPKEAEEAHRYCRSVINEKWGTVAQSLVIQYGGSVNPENAKSLLDQANIDGLLVGGASLSPETFSQIINAQIKVPL